MEENNNKSRNRRFIPKFFLFSLYLKLIFQLLYNLRKNLILDKQMLIIIELDSSNINFIIPIISIFLLFQKK